LYPGIATGVVTAFDVVLLLEQGIELFPVDVIITGKIRIDEDDFLFLGELKQRCCIIRL
jgi:hypothetical protein